MTCWSVVSFDSRLSEGKVPARSEKLVTMRQKSSSAIRAGSESAVANTAPANATAQQQAARVAVARRTARRERIRAILSYVVRRSDSPGPETFSSKPCSSEAEESTR